MLEVSKFSLISLSPFRKFHDLKKKSSLGDTGTHLFGVFDGHGETGDACSFFAADKFPTCLEKQLASVVLFLFRGDT